MPASSSRPALSVIGGGLGAGKTSLIARLLQHPHMGPTGVVVNEFGAFGVDDLVMSSQAPEAQLALLKNGCICCRPGNDLSEAVRKIIKAAEQPLDRIVVETSGVAELSAVLAKVGADHVLRAMVRLDAAVALVDATAPDEARPEHIACADRIVITKSDLVSGEVFAGLYEQLRTMNSNAPVFDGQSELDPDLVFNAGLIDRATGAVQADKWLHTAGHVHVHDQDGDGDHHSHEIRSWLIEAGPQKWTMLTQQISEMSRAAGPALLRLKGIVVDQDDARPLALQMVRDQIYRPVRLAPDVSDGRSKIVVIARDAAAPAVEQLAQRIRAEMVPAESL